MSRDPVPARLCASWDDMDLPGDYHFTSTGMVFLCPCGCGDTLGINFTGEKPGCGPKWVFDGNRESPTVTPSVRRLGGCEWHGFLTAGKWLTC